MGKRLFITEKPSVAMEFAKALGASRNRNSNGFIEDGDTIITWCVGHLIEMSYPEAYDPALKTWSLDTLPFIPRTYKYEVIPRLETQYKVVASLLNRSDVTQIYYSGDSAREGEYIQRLVRQCAGRNPKAEEYRVWIDSQTKEEIQRGIREAKPLSAYDNLSDSAYARAIEDYLVGINFSRVLSLKYANIVSGAVNDNKYHSIAVGRVMSCVLGMVVNRERAIRNTRIVSYYTIQADLGNGLKADWKITGQSPFKNTPDNYNDIGLLDKIPVSELLAKLVAKGQLTVTDKKESTSSKMAPLLFNLAELQSECAKLYKISPADTLAIAQSLYEKKLTTYPRTDARVLTTAITKVYQDNIKGLQSVPEVADAAKNVLSANLYDPAHMVKTKYVDDSKVSDHYAIIPTGQTDGLSALSDLERQVYTLIARRFLAIFYPPAKYEKIAYTLMGENETFAGSATKLVSEGYLAVYGHKEEEGNVAYGAAKALSGDVPASFEMREGKSKPPARYTSGSMILAMENAGNLIEDEELREQIKGSGIGTSATRADVIEKLAKNQYIKIDKKSQVISPQALGEIIYDVLLKATPNILNPAYTASWEKGLAGIVDGSVTKEHYMAKIYDYINHGVNSMKSSDYRNEVAAAIAELKKIYPSINTSGQSSRGDSGYTCPICGKPIRSNDKGYYCSGYKEGCRFSIWKVVAGKTLPASAIQTMIGTWENDGNGGGHSGATKEISGFKFKSGPGKAKLRLTMAPGEKMKTEFVFAARK